MKYIYEPDTYDRKKIQEYNFDNQQFLNCQVKYRESLEIIIKNIFDFSTLDASLVKYEIPKLNDSSYNFYHKFTNLNSNYIYLRNNIHIERLNAEDIRYINSCIIDRVPLEPKFITKTLNMVIFEEGDFIHFGPANIKNRVESKSIVFEFAFDQMNCKDVQHLLRIEDIYMKYIKPQIISKLGTVLKIPISVIKYNGIPDLFIKDEIELGNVIKL